METGSSIETLSPIVEPVLSLDRLTVLMQTGPVMGMYGSADADYFNKKKSAINGLVNKMRLQYARLFEPKQPTVETGLYLYHFRLVGGFDLQMCPKFGIKCRIDDEGYVSAFGTETEIEQFKQLGYIDEYFDSDFGIRIEFNPSKSDLADIAPLLTFLSATYYRINPDITFDRLFKVTRLDVAVDYPLPLNPALFAYMRKRKCGWVGGSEGVETTYFGSRRTAFYWRIYDKKREYLEQQHIDYQGADLWRIELECKKPFSIGEDPHFCCQQFRGLEYYYGGISTGDWKMDMILHYGKCFGMQNAFKMIPRQSRIRYQEQFSRLNFESMKHPASIVGWELPKQWRSLYDKFKNTCGRRHDPMLFQRNIREDM